MVKAKSEIAHLVLWLGLLDARKCGNLLACYQRTPEATIKQGTSIYYQTNNFYTALARQERLDKEVRAIVKGKGKDPKQKA